MILRKENRKPPSLKKAGIVLTWNVHLKPLKVTLLTDQNIIKIVTELQPGLHMGVIGSNYQCLGQTMSLIL